MSLTRRTFSNSVAALVMLAAMTGAGACSDSSGGPTAARDRIGATDPAPVTATDLPPGTYVLEQIDGNALPYTSDGKLWETGSLTLMGDGEITGALSWRSADESDPNALKGQTDALTGTVGVYYGHIVFAIDGDPAYGVVDGDTLTVNSAGVVYVFRRA
jgi:hypothetical protein